MKTNLKPLALFVLAAFALSSCGSDDDAALMEEAPVISNFEYGEGGTHGDEKVAYKGADVHMEAEINAVTTVSSITVDIHAHNLEPAEGEEAWELEQVYTDADYLVINPTFHEHIDVPETAPAGDYHLTLTVTDANGNSTEVEGYIHITDPITLSEISIDETVQRGTDFHTEFMIDAVHGIHNVTVDVHAHGLTVGEGEVEWHFEQVFEEGYHEETSVEFHEHIDVPETAPAGEYHMVITIEDEEGNISVIDTHIDVTV